MKKIDNENLKKYLSGEKEIPENNVLFFHVKNKIDRREMHNYLCFNNPGVVHISVKCSNFSTNPYCIKKCVHCGSKVHMKYTNCADDLGINENDYKDFEYGYDTFKSYYVGDCVKCGSENDKDPYESDYESDYSDEGEKRRFKRKFKYYNDSNVIVVGCSPHKSYEKRNKCTTYNKKYVAELMDKYVGFMCEKPDGIYKKNKIGKYLNEKILKNIDIT